MNHLRRRRAAVAVVLALAWPLPQAPVSAQETLQVTGFKSSTIRFRDQDQRIIDTLAAQDASWLIGATLWRDPDTQLYVIELNGREIYIATWDLHTTSGAGVDANELCGRILGSDDNYRSSSGLARFCSP